MRGEVLLAFAGEGVYVEGFYAVAKFYKAEGVVTLDLSEASGCFCGGGMVMWVVSEEIGIGESLDDEKETQQRGLRDRVNPTLVPAIRIPGPREQTYTTETRSLVGVRREGSTRAEV